MNSMTSESLHRHMPEPVKLGHLAAAVAHHYGARTGIRYGLTKELTFAHVLNVPVSEDIWPGEAVDLFPQPFFAKSPDTGMFVHEGRIFEHMRCETLRLCSGRYSAKEFMEDELVFYYEFDGPSPFGFGDSSDDEDELPLDYPLTWD